jgi:O-antigen ligase
LFISLYLILFAGLIYTENFKQAMFEIFEKKVALLLFPFILVFSPPLTFRQSKIILLSFVFGCLATGIFCLLVATYQFFVFNDLTFLFYHNLSQLAGMHAIYLAMFLCFSIVILLFFLHEKRNTLSVNQKVVLYLGISLCIVLIFLLSGRTHIILLVIGATGYFIYRFSRKYNAVIGILAAVIISMLLVGLALLLPSNRERFKEAINYKDQYSLEKKWGEQQMRPLMWACAWELIHKSPVTGVGTGDGQDDLEQCYINNEYVSLTYFVGVRFNAHNQYLETAVELGLIGLLVFVSCLVYAVAYAINTKNTLYLIFIIIFSFSCATESLLERQSGVIFFAFFNSFLFIYGNCLRKHVTVINKQEN